MDWNCERVTDADAGRRAAKKGSRDRGLGVYWRMLADC